MKKNSVLWKIYSDVNTQPSFLFGTMHIRDRVAFNKLDLLKECIASCSHYAAEFDLQEQYNADHSRMTQLPDNMRISDYVSEKKMLKIDKILLKLTGYRIANFQHTYPMVITNLLSTSVLSNDMLESLDDFLYKHAQQAGLTCTGVETYEEQLAIFKKIPIDFQIKGLISFVRNFSKYRKEIHKMCQYYLEEDIYTLYRSAKSGLNQTRKLLLYERNEKMAIRIAELINSNPTFCAIGAGHLAGYKGVIRLLKFKGFKVVPVTENN